VDLLGENFSVDVARLVNVHRLVQLKNGVAMSLDTVADDVQDLVDLAHVNYSLPWTQQLSLDKLLFLSLATHAFVYVLHR